MSIPNWLRSLRRTEIIDVVCNNPSTKGDYFFGIHKDEVFNQVIGGGQGDFDIPYGHLSGSDRSLLYAYFNQLGHLEELIEAFGQLFKNGPPADPLIVVDLGCGPFTGGLALASVLGDGARFSYIGLDRSSTMRELGERLAAVAEQVGALNCSERHWVEDFASVQWHGAPGWRPILVIASYLLASPTLDAESLVADFMELCTRLGRGPITVLYTNSPSMDANRNFEAFRAALEKAGFSIIADDLGSITVERLAGLKERRLRYALFQRHAQKVLYV